MRILAADTSKIHPLLLCSKTALVVVGAIMAAQAVFADPAYGNYGKVETLRSVAVDATLGDAGAPMPAVTGAGEIVVRNCQFENNCRGRQRDCPWNMGADLVSCLGLPPDVKLAEADKRHVSRILVENCTFRDSFSYVAAFNFGRDITFRHNQVENTGTRQDRLPTSGSIRLRHVDNVRLEDNRFVVPPGSPKPSIEIGDDVTGVFSRGNVVR